MAKLRAPLMGLGKATLVIMRAQAGGKQKNGQQVLGQEQVGRQAKVQLEVEEAGDIRHGEETRPCCLGAAKLG